MSIPETLLSFIEADGVRIFYRHAGPTSANAPTVVLLHGFPTSSHMFRHLIPQLAARGYRVLAPDLPGFGLTDVSPARQYTYSFASLAKTFGAFVDALKLNGEDVTTTITAEVQPTAQTTRRFAVYIFDYGSPTALRFAALQRPDALAALVTQNGNAYEEGLGYDFWAPLQAYWAKPLDDRATREPLKQALTGEAIRWQYEHGRPGNSKMVPPEAYLLDEALLQRPKRTEQQLDLFHDYGSNVALYPQFQAWLRSADGPPVLAIWGRHDEIFVAAGAEAFGRDVPAPKFRLHWLEAGHFALETHEVEVAQAMDDFFQAQGVFEKRE